MSGVSFNSAGPSRSILQSVVRGAIRPVLSPMLEAEYRRVLARPQFVERHGMGETKLDQFLKVLLIRAVVDYPRPAPVRAPDPDDQMLWDLLHAVPESMLVTGEAALSRAPDFAGRIFTPRQFVDRFQMDS